MLSGSFVQYFDSDPCIHPGFISNHNIHFSSIIFTFSHVNVLRKYCDGKKSISGFLQTYLLWHIDPSVGKDLETNETTAVAMQRRGKHTCTTIELLLEMVLCNPLLGSCNSWTTTMETGVFSVWFVPRIYLEDHWGDRVNS
jgi:hypothetical protein